jgi:hypothetical protein
MLLDVVATAASRAAEREMREDGAGTLDAFAGTVALLVERVVRVGTG